MQQYTYSSHPLIIEEAKRIHEEMLKLKSPNSACGNRYVIEISETYTRKGLSSSDVIAELPYKKAEWFNGYTAGSVQSFIQVDRIEKERADRYPMFIVDRSSNRLSAAQRRTNANEYFRHGEKYILDGRLHKLNICKDSQNSKIPVYVFTCYHDKQETHLFSPELTDHLPQLAPAKKQIVSIQDEKHLTPQALVQIAEDMKPVFEADRITKKLRTLQDPNYNEKSYCVKACDSNSRCDLTDIIEHLPYPVSEILTSKDAKGQFIVVSSEDKKKTDQELRKQDKQRFKPSKQKDIER